MHRNYFMKNMMIVLAFFTACNNNKQTQQDNTTAKKPVWTDRLNGKQYPLPDFVGGKPVSFYLYNANIASIAKAFYRSQFRPGDNDSTTQLLSYVTTADSTIRPFYRWCLDFTITISDGALGEYPGDPALQYATKFPAEFFKYMDEDRSGERYKRWTEIIAYSGLNDYSKPESEIQKEIINSLQQNCVSCSDDIKSRIKIFAEDITNDLKLQD